MTPEQAREHLALAMDLPLPQAEQLYQEVARYVGYVKVGLSLFVEHGPTAVRAFTRQGAKVFLDLKLHDIPNTVQLAAMRAAELGVSLLTVHAQGGPAMVRAAVEGARLGAERAGVRAPRLLAITLLTSLSADEVLAIGGSESPEALVKRLADLAQSAGADGIVCSPHELLRLRRSLGEGVYLCAPGIRRVAARDDQARAATPSFALKAGADLLVVGRPIYAAPDPIESARAHFEEILSFSG